MEIYSPQQAEAIIAEIKQVVAQKPAVRIVLPNSAPYLSLVHQRFPNIK